MSTVPVKAADAIAWVDTRVPVWSAAGLTIGLDPLEVGELGALLSAAKDLKAEWETIQAAADAKGIDYRASVKAMRTKASGQVTQIRGFARSKGNPDSIFSAAQIPLPADPGPAPAPGTPEGFKRELLDNGGFKFTFTCDHPTGVKAVQYKIERQPVPQTPFVFLQNAKKREFEDITFLGSSTVINYRVTAQTSTKDGPSSSFTVRYGADNQQATIIAQGPAVESQAG